MFAFIEINWDTFGMMSKLLLGMVGILLLIYVLAVLTPKLAKLVDKLLGKANPGKNMSPARVKDEDGKEYQVKDIYEGGKTEDASSDNNNEDENKNNTDIDPKE